MENKELQKLESEANKIREKIDSIKEKEIFEKVIPFLKSFRNTSYKGRNNYSCPEKPSDYWWLYVKILDFVQDSDGYVHFVVEKFQTDKDGQCYFEIFNEYTYHDMREPMSHYTKISNLEYEKQRAKFFKEIVSQTKMRQTISTS